MKRKESIPEMVHRSEANAALMRALIAIDQIRLGTVDERVVPHIKALKEAVEELTAGLADHELRERTLKALENMIDKYELELARARLRGVFKL